MLQSSEQKSADTRLLIRTLREMTDITEVTPIIVNKLIERIEVHNNDKSSGHCYVKVDIYFTGVGGIPPCSIAKGIGATPFTGLHRTLHKILPYVVCPNWQLFFFLIGDSLVFSINRNIMP